MRRVTVVASGSVVLAAAAVLLLPSTAWAVFEGSEHIRRFDSDITIEPDGSLTVVETIDYDFDGLFRHGVYRDIPVRFPYDDRYEREYPLEVVSVGASPGAPSEYVIEEEGALDRIRIGDPDIEISGRHTYEIAYRVEGALNGFRDHDELYWNATGNEWTVPMAGVDIRVRAPADITEVACYQGSEGSTAPCNTAVTKGGSARFAHSLLGPYQGVTFVVGLPKGAVPAPQPILVERWSISRAFEATPATLGISGALLVALVGGTLALAYRHGRDRRWRGSPIDAVHGAPAGTDQEMVPLHDDLPLVVEFAPPDDLRPGQIGTLIDERAQPLDATATIVDLAVRGYLVIEEIPKEGLFGKADWRLRKLHGSEGLLAYERTLFDALFEGGDETLLSELKNEFHDDLAKAQGELYDHVVDDVGWFERRPDQVRAKWSLLGILAVLVAGGILYLVAANTHLGLVAIPVVIAALVLLVAARWMPRRTPTGSGTLRRVLGFRHMMETADVELARFAERENLYYQFMPYAVVFGITDRWAKAFEVLGSVPPQPSWYVSPNPFTVAAFSTSVQRFATASAGVVASTPSSSGSSGFGGGGFSGGGGGGGGGGSW